MEHPPKLLNQTLMCTSLREKDYETDENPISDVLVSIVLIKHHQLTCLLLDVSLSNKLKRMIGEKVPTSTRSPK